MSQAISRFFCNPVCNTAASTMKLACATALLVILGVLAAPSLSARPQAPALAFVEKVLGRSADGALPLLIVLHGLGDSPEQFSTLFAGLDVPVRLIAPRAPDAWDVGTSWFPIDDPKRAPAVIAARAELIAKLVEYLGATRAVRGKPIVTGFSQGGYLSFALAARHNAHFASALPIAGALPAALPPPKKARAGFRVIAFHGEADQRVPYAEGERAVAKLKSAGVHATLTSYPKLAHAISPALERDYMAALREELARIE